MVWAVSLLTFELIPKSLTYHKYYNGVLSLYPLGTENSAHAETVLYSHYIVLDSCAYTHFGENQLAPNSFGISPLTTPHPMILQHQPVRASTQFYLCFTLDMVRSSGFGSITINTRYYVARFHSGFEYLYLLTFCLNCHDSSAPSSTGTQSGPCDPSIVCRHRVSCSFHSPLGVLFTFPSRY